MTNQLCLFVIGKLDFYDIIIDYDFLTLYLVRIINTTALSYISQNISVGIYQIWILSLNKYPFFIYAELGNLLDEFVYSSSLNYYHTYYFYQHIQIFQSQQSINHSPLIFGLISILILIILYSNIVYYSINQISSNKTYEIRRSR